MDLFAIPWEFVCPGDNFWLQVCWAGVNTVTPLVEAHFLQRLAFQALHFQLFVYLIGEDSDSTSDCVL